MNETLKVLHERRSIRKYKAEQITDQELDAILEAGTWAPTAKNLQTPVMVVVQDKETIAFDPENPDGDAVFKQSGQRLAIIGG